MIEQVEEKIQWERREGEEKHLDLLTMALGVDVRMTNSGGLKENAR